MEKLIDQYGRQINYLRISVTDRCNLRCLYCLPETGLTVKPRGEILTYEEIRQVTEAAVSCGINKVRLTGGEPLNRRDIISLVGSLSKIEGLTDLSLTTNGVLLNEYAEGLKKAGLKRVNISLDSLNREKFKLITRFDALDRVWKGIEKVLQIGFNPVKINVVVMNGINDDEIIDFARLTYKYPLQVRFIEFMPVGNRYFWTADKFISNQEVKTRCQGLGHHLSFISPLSRPFCAQCSRLRLTCDGKLRVCLGSREEIDLLPVLRSGQDSWPKLKEMFISAVRLKPKNHHFSSPDFSESKTMCQIGG